MALLTVYISDELRNKLIDVDNKSSLVSNLLNNYLNDDLETIPALELKRIELEREYRVRIADLTHKIEQKQIEAKEKERKAEKEAFIKKAQEMARRGEI